MIINAYTRGKCLRRKLRPVECDLAGPQSGISYDEMGSGVIVYQGPVGMLRLITPSMRPIYLAVQGCKQHFDVV